MALGSDEDQTVQCIACGATRARDEAREYDRYGNRWERADKTFEYLCKPCHVTECHLPRQDLEETLLAVDRQPSPVAFVEQYYRQVLDRIDPEEQPDR